MVSSWPGAQEVSGSSPSSLETPPTHTHTHALLLHTHCSFVLSLHPLSSCFSAPDDTHSHTLTLPHAHIHTHINPHKIKYFNPPNVSTHPCCTPCGAALNRTWVYCQSLQQAEPGTSSILAVTEADVLGQCHPKPSPCLTSLLISIPPLSFSFLPLLFLLCASLSSTVSLSILHREFTWNIWLQSFSSMIDYSMLWMVCVCVCVCVCVQRVKREIQNAPLCEQVPSAAGRWDRQREKDGTEGVESSLEGKQKGMAGKEQWRRSFLNPSPRLDSDSAWR